MDSVTRFRVESARALADRVWMMVETLEQIREEARAANAGLAKLSADELAALGLEAKAAQVAEDDRVLAETIALLQQSGTGPNLAAGASAAKTEAHRSKKDREAMAKKAGAEAPKPKAAKAVAK